MRRTLTTLAGLALALGVLQPVNAVEAEVPTAQQVPSVPATGALFYPSVLGLLPTLGGPHFCSASVVDSPTKDLLVTAAHCVFGVGPVIEFVPLLSGASNPHGVWSVTRIYIDPEWKKSFDPKHDIAFLRVAKQGSRKIEDVVPGLPLAQPQVGQPVAVSGYPMGSRGRPISCGAPLAQVSGFTAIACRGFGNGTSGGPWVQGGNLVGVIGGLEQGGCTADAEYSLPFGPRVQALYDRAVAGGAGDFVPVGFTANAC